MTVGDLVELWSTLHANTERDFQCSTCLRSCPGAPQKLVEKRRNRACQEPSEQPRFMLETPTGTRISYRTCIGNLYSEGWDHWIQVYRQYKRGLLPFPGSVLEQPAKVFEVFSIIENFEVELEKKKAAKGRKRG